MIDDPTQLTTAEPAPLPIPKPIPGYLPEMHHCVPQKGVITIPCVDDTTRDYLCLDQGMSYSVYCSFDPAMPEELQIFRRDPAIFHKATDSYRFQYAGVGCLMRTTDLRGTTKTHLRNPWDLNPEKWEPAISIIPYQLCYLRDNAGRIALGYYDGPKASGLLSTSVYQPSMMVIVSGPRDLVALQFQTASFAKPEPKEGK
jgi:hypothetical protein